MSARHNTKCGLILDVSTVRGSIHFKKELDIRDGDTPKSIRAKVLDKVFDKYDRTYVEHLLRD
jgi:hypothetical protein